MRIANARIVATTRRYVVLTLTALLVSMPAVTGAQMTSDAQQGAADGARDGKAEVSHTRWFAVGCAGCATPPVGTIIALVHRHRYRHTPAVERFAGTSPEYRRAYLSAYDEAARRATVKPFWTGMVVGAVVFATVAALMVRSWTKRMNDATD